MNKLTKMQIGLFVIALLAVIWFFLPKPIEKPFGSVTVGNEYNSTTTPTSAAGRSWEDQLLKNGAGALGSVIITEAGNVKYLLYDATSTASLTNGNFDASQRRLASIVPSQAAGTYTFDVGFNYGLLLDAQSGSTGTSTITFR